MRFAGGSSFSVLGTRGGEPLYMLECLSITILAQPMYTGDDGHRCALQGPVMQKPAGQLGLKVRHRHPQIFGLQGDGGDVAAHCHKLDCSVGLYCNLPLTGILYNC